MDIIESCQDFNFVVDHGEGVLVVGRGLAVFCAASPAVAFDDDVAAAKVDHRFDADAHAVADNGTDATPTVVGDFGGFVHAAADAVTTHFAHDGVTAVLAVGLDGVGDVADAMTGAAGFYADVERLFGCAAELHDLGVDFADGECIA